MRAMACPAVRALAGELTAAENGVPWARPAAAGRPVSESPLVTR